MVSICGKFSTDKFEDYCKDGSKFARIFKTIT